MPNLTIELRRLMASKARSARTRIAQFSREMPTDWNPTVITNPKTGFPFQDESAWLLIAELLESNHPVEELVLEKPPGTVAYVMKHTLEDNTRVYIKIHMGARQKVIGRSFHIDLYH